MTRTGTLTTFDVLFFCRGSPASQGKNAITLAQQLSELVREFQLSVLDSSSRDVSVFFFLAQLVSFSVFQCIRFVGVCMT